MKKIFGCLAFLLIVLLSVGASAQGLSGKTKAPAVKVPAAKVSVPQKQAPAPLPAAPAKVPATKSPTAESYKVIFIAKDDSGNRLQGVKIFLTGPDNWHGKTKVVDTARNGTAVFENLKAGDYIYHVWKVGYLLDVPGAWLIGGLKIANLAVSTTIEKEIVFKMYETRLIDMVSPVEKRQLEFKVVERGGDYETATVIPADDVEYVISLKPVCNTDTLYGEKGTVLFNGVIQQECSSPDNCKYFIEYWPKDTDSFCNMFNSKVYFYKPGYLPVTMHFIDVMHYNQIETVYMETIHE